MDNRNFKKHFLVTLVILLVLVVVLTYFLFIKPKLQGYVVNKQIEGKDLTLITILNQVQQQGYAQIAYGNQTLILVPYNPNQQVAPQPAQQPATSGKVGK